MSKREFDEKYYAKDEGGVSPILIYMLFALLIISIIAGIMVILSQGGQCLKNPSAQLIKVLEKSTNSNVYCTCAFSNPLIGPIFISNLNTTTPR